MRRFFSAVLLLCVAAPFAHAAFPTISLSLPTTVPTGAPFVVTVNAADTDGDLSVMSLRYQGFGTQNTWNGSFGASVSQPWTMTAPGSVGTMNLRGEVFDAAGNGTTGEWYTVNVVQNVAPTATISAPSPRVTGEPCAINFSVADSNGNLSQWRFYAATNSNPQWSNVPNGTSASGTHTTSFASAGTYRYWIEAKDTSGATAAQYIDIVVTTNSTPTASITPASGTLFVNQTGSWPFSVSDSNGNLARWRLSLLPATAQWSTISGSSQSATQTYSFSTAGNYTFRLNVEDTASAAASADANVTVAPNPQMSDPWSVTNTAFMASWASHPAVTTHRVELSTNSSFSSQVAGFPKDFSNGTNYYISGLAPSTTYYVRVRGVGTWGYSAYSNVKSVTTSANAPAAPVATAATSVTGTSFTGNWGTVSGAAKYLVDVSTSSAFPNYVGSYWNYDVGSATSATITGLTPGTTYYFRVHAENGGGYGPYSNTITVGTTPPNGDGDNDGMLDSWEDQNFGSTAALPDADPDGDGLRNIRESYLGTNPNADDRTPAPANALKVRLPDGSYQQMTLPNFD